MKRDTDPVQPETRYARSGKVNVAYQVMGEGSIDLVYVNVISHLEIMTNWAAARMINGSHLRTARLYAL